MVVHPPSRIETNAGRDRGRARRSLGDQQTRVRPGCECEKGVPGRAKVDASQAAAGRKQDLHLNQEAHIQVPSRATTGRQICQVAVLLCLPTLFLGRLQFRFLALQAWDCGSIVRGRAPDQRRLHGENRRHRAARLPGVVLSDLTTLLSSVRSARALCTVAE